MDYVQTAIRQAKFHAQTCKKDLCQKKKQKHLMKANDLLYKVRIENAVTQKIDSSHLLDILNVQEFIWETIISPEIGEYHIPRILNILNSLLQKLEKSS